jgi:hypothetical protein
LLPVSAVSDSMWVPLIAVIHCACGERLRCSWPVLYLRRRLRSLQYFFD